MAFAIIAFAAAARAQSPNANPWFIRAGVAPGFILPTNPFAASPDFRVESIEWGPDLTIEVGRRTDGTRTWHELYGMPSYGFGVSMASFRNSLDAVRPREAYAFFSWPFASLTEHVDITTDFSLGASWDWKQTLGSNLNARIDWGFYLRTLLTPQTVLFTGVDFTHRSNGGLSQPNLGINVLGPKVMMQYNFGTFGHDVPVTRELHRPEGFQPEWAFVVALSGGLKNVIAAQQPLLRQDFGTFGLNPGVQRQFYRFGRIVGGVDVMYDGSTGAGRNMVNPLWRAEPGARWATGINAGYEHLIGRFSAAVQVGYRVARGYEDVNAPRLYQRYSWTYAVNQHVFSTFAIRATDGRRADALEVGAGYRWPRF